MASGEKKRKKDGTEINVTMTGKKKKQQQQQQQQQQMTDGTESEDVVKSATVDLDLFDCPICFEPLQPPLFQCKNGHIACSSCCKKLKDKCPSCGLSNNHSRCLALEKIIESFKVPCSYDGCKEIMSYSKLLEHENRCIYAPCVCPMPNCTFSGSTKVLPTHIQGVHKQSPEFIKNYGYSSTVYNVSVDRPFEVIVGPDGDVFLLLIQKVSLDVWNGYSLSLVCINRPQASGNEFQYELFFYDKRNEYELSYFDRRRVFILKDCVPNVKEWKGCHPTDTFLVVPRSILRNNKLVAFIALRKM